MGNNDFVGTQNKSKDLLDFNYKLIDRFKTSKLKPYEEANHNSKYLAKFTALKIISDVDGLFEFYTLVGSPKIDFRGRSSENHRGNTPPDGGVVWLYNGAYKTNYWLASTIFHELTHVYQDKYMGITINEAERMAYSVEWRLGNRDPSIWKFSLLYQNN